VKIVVMAKNILAIAEVCGSLKGHITYRH
jgi:hypothetical protein